MNDTVWDLLFPDDAVMLKMSLMAIAKIPDQQYCDALDQLNRQEAIMPMIDPTAWLSGQRFKNLEEYKLVIGLMRQIATTIRKEPL